MECEGMSPWRPYHPLGIVLTSEKAVVNPVGFHHLFSRIPIWCSLVHTQNGKLGSLYLILTMPHQKMLEQSLYLYSPGSSHSDLMGLDVSVLSPWDWDYQAWLRLRRWNMGSFQHCHFLFSTFVVFILTQLSKTVSFLWHVLSRGDDIMWLLLGPGELQLRGQKSVLFVLCSE